MPSSVLITIVLPTRDRPQLVAATLRAIKAQSFADFEVIISDNGVHSLCYDQVSPYLTDNRFIYKRPEKPLDMCNHWEFAIEGARGKYVTVFCEKFILRPDALECLAEEVSRSMPDVLTWQFEMFDVLETDGDRYLGHYHPLLKPGTPITYDPQAELVRRFSFDFPIFSRFNKQKESYGKIYSGMVHCEVLTRIKHRYGRIFHPLSPDFTSMSSILNESKVCVDINQALMLCINISGASNGEATKTSVTSCRQAIASYCLDVDEFVQGLPIPGYWIGHQNYIAADLLLIQGLAPSGVIKTLSLDITALAFWAVQDLEVIEEWGDAKPQDFLNLILPFLDEKDELIQQRLNGLIDNLQRMNTPSLQEIYHSGLNKCNEFVVGTTAEELAKIHWCDHVAPPRKNVVDGLISLEDATTYLYKYNLESCKLLGISREVGL